MTADATIRDAAIFRLAREEIKKWTQQEVAEASGLSEVTIRRLERADPTVEGPTRRAVAKVLGLEWDWQNECLSTPTNIQPAAIDWGIRQLNARLAANGRDENVFDAAEMAKHPKAAAATKSQKKRKAMNRKRKRPE